MVANTITITRILLAFIVIGMLFFIESDRMFFTAFGLTVLVIWMDGLDGFFARLLNECSKFGAVLDILGDRIVENVYWIAFASMGWIPVWIPLVVVSRGIITDGLRSIALEQGYTAFGSETMMQSKLGKFIVASNFCRFTYAVCKAIAFAFLILANMPGDFAGKDIVWTVAYAATYISVTFCVLRGIPVIMESKRFFPSNENK